MASNDDKKKARELLAANPDMKYTEALRAVQQGRTGEPNTKTVHWTPREPFLGFSDALGDGAPTPSAEGDDWARSALRGADLSGALRDLDLTPEGDLDPFRIASKMASTEEALNVSVTTTTGPSLTVRSPNRVPTSPVFDLRLMDDLTETTADQTPFMLKVTQNMLLTSPSGVGGVAARHLLAAWLDEQGVYVDLIGADDPIPGFGGRSLDPDQAAPFLASVEGAHAVILNRPEEFEDPDAWWAAVTPLLDRPRMAVIVHTADPAAIPDEVRRSLAVRAGMGLHLMDKDDVELAMGEGLPESELEKASPRGRMLVRQGDECTVLMIDQRR